MRRSDTAVTEQQKKMTTETNIESAIARSISHTEIVRVSVSDIQFARAAVGLIADECDDAREDDGSLDVWGVRNGSEFRIRVCGN